MEELQKIVQMCSDSLHCLLDSGCDVNYYVQPDHFTKLRQTALAEVSLNRMWDEEVAKWYV